MASSQLSKSGWSRRDLFRGAAVAGAGLAAGHLPARPLTVSAGEQAGGQDVQYSIWYLEYANVPAFPVSGLLYGAHNQGGIDTPFGYTILKGMGTIAIFDVGFRGEGKGFELGKLFGAGNYESPDVVLAKIGMSPAEVQHAFIGHAHFDHADNIPAFPNAHIYIQEREITAWMAALQLPAQLGWVTGAFNPQDIMDAVQRSLDGRATLVLGEMSDVLPGIDIHPAHDTHTFGTQYITARMGSGANTQTWAMVGDAIYTYVNLEGNAYGLGAGTYTPLGYAQGHQVTQLETMYQVVQQVGGTINHIVPGHDHAVFDRFPSKRMGLNRVAELRLAPGEPSRL